MNTKILLIGAGGHAKVLLDTLQLVSKSVIGITDIDAELHGTVLLDTPIIGADNVIFEYDPSDILLVNGIGSTTSTSQRQKIYEVFSDRLYKFLSVVHPETAISRNAILSEGVQIFAGSVVQAGTRIGKNTILNSSVSIDHDCIVGDHVHIAPGVTLSGNVEVGNGSHIGVGSTILQGVEIGANCLVAAGAVVVDNVQSGTMVMGVPAMKKVLK